MSYNPSGNITKQRILACAAELFAEKGFTETTIRELAEAAGLNGSSLYYHFPSKHAILEQILEDFSAHNTDVFGERNIIELLRQNPTADGIMDCMQLSFPPDKAQYYMKVLCVLLQEQLRNPTVCKYMSEQFILRAETNTKKIIDTLKELGVIRQDADPDFWVKIVSSLFYSFSARSMLGIGDSSAEFTGMGLAEMLRHTFDVMLEKYGVSA